MTPRHSARRDLIPPVTRTLKYFRVVAFAAAAGLLTGYAAAVIDLDRVVGVEWAALMGVGAPLASVSRLRPTDTDAPYKRGGWLVDTRHNGFDLACLVVSCERVAAYADSRWPWRVTWRTIDGAAGGQSSTFVDDEGRDCLGQVHPMLEDSEPTVRVCGCCGGHAAATPKVNERAVAAAALAAFGRALAEIGHAWSGLNEADAYNDWSLYFPLGELARWDGTCPTCHGPLEVTPSSAVVCREHGSEHYRVERSAWAGGAS